jgi:polar amino acid transport system substrate-binding protein
MSRPRWARRLGMLWPSLLLVLLVTVVLVFLVSRLTASPARPLKPIFVVSGDWQPFVGEDLPGGGPVARLVTEVLQRQGYAPGVAFTTWPLAQQRTDDRSVIGGFPFVGSEARRAEYLLSDPLVEFEYVLFVRRGQQLTGADDLRALDVAHIDGYDYWPELEETVTDFVEYPSKEAAFAALASGEVDVVPEGRDSGAAVLSSRSFSGDSSAIVAVEPGDDPLLGSTETMHFMLARTEDNRRFLDEFNRMLAEVKRTDVYDDVMTSLEAGSGADELTLQPVGATGLVVLTDRSGRLLITPAGTRVRVVTWPAAFTQGLDRLPTRPVRVVVKVLDGPARGRVMTVDARALVLDGGAR